MFCPSPEVDTGAVVLATSTRQTQIAMHTGSEITTAVSPSVPAPTDVRRNGRVAPRRSGHGSLVWTGRILAVLVGLSLVGAAYESSSEAAGARAYPPPGQMVDVGGYRL